MKIRKTIPPVSVPISSSDLFHGVKEFLGGDESEGIKREFREYSGARHIFFLSSGKAALFMILIALRELKNRRKVIMPAYTCFSVPSAIRMAGLEIVLCDVRPDFLDFDHDQLEKLADEETLCIIATHLFGIPSEIGRVREIAREKEIFVIEDAAQAFGALVGRMAGSQGDVAFFSLGRGKNITCGSGGIIVTDSEEIAGALLGPYNRLEKESLQNSAKTLLELFLMELFMNPYLYWLPDGLPFLRIGETHFYSSFPVVRMNRAKFGLLHNWQRKLDSLNKIRTDTSEEYKHTLNLNRGIGIYSKKHPYLRFPVYLKNEERKRDICKNYRHLGVSPMYPGAINAIPELSGIVGNFHCPASEMIARKLVTLPTHGFVDGVLGKKICSVVSDALDDTYRNL